jgi:hypothetical protein
MDELDLGQTIRGFAAGQKLFGRYTLSRILGGDGMGIVWLAYHEQLDREVASSFCPTCCGVIGMPKDLNRDIEINIANRRLQGVVAGFQNCRL